MSKLDDAMTAYAVSHTEAHRLAIADAVAPELRAEIATLKACLAQREQSLIEAKRRELAGIAAPVASVQQSAPVAYGVWSHDGSTLGLYDDAATAAHIAKSYGNASKIIQLYAAAPAAAPTPPAAADVSAPTDERQAFEAWVRKEYGPGRAPNFDAEWVTEAWPVWQAARAAAPVSGQGASIDCDAFWLLVSACKDAKPGADYIEKRNALVQFIDSRPCSEDSRAKVLFDLLVESQDDIGGTWRARRDTAVAAAELVAAQEAKTEARELTDADISFELMQDDQLVAATSGPGAEKEIQHYAAQYEQDGPVEIIKCVRTSVRHLTPSKG